MQFVPSKLHELEKLLLLDVKLVVLHVWGVTRNASTYE